MVVDVLPVRMGGNNKRILALGKTHGKFVAHLVSFLCSDFPRTKGLPYLISDHIAFLSASVYEIILPLGKHKFFICCQGATSIAADILPLLGLVRVFNISQCLAESRFYRVDFCDSHKKLPEKKDALCEMNLT